MRSDKDYEGVALEYFIKDRHIADIFVEDGKVLFNNYTDNVMEKPFGNMTTVTLRELKRLLDYRCVPRGRFNLNDILRDETADVQGDTVDVIKSADIVLFEEDGGSSEPIKRDDYDYLNLVRITHGVMSDDFFWLRFKGEDITWDDVKDWHYHTADGNDN